MDYRVRYLDELASRPESPIFLCAYGKFIMGPKREVCLLSRRMEYKTLVAQRQQWGLESSLAING